MLISYRDQMLRFAHLTEYHSEYFRCLDSETGHLLLLASNALFVAANNPPGRYRRNQLRRANRLIKQARARWNN